jgi:hypothetical protein
MDESATGSSRMRFGALHHQRPAKTLVFKLLRSESKAAQKARTAAS